MFGQRAVKAAVAAGVLAVGGGGAVAQQPAPAPLPKAAAPVPERQLLIDATYMTVPVGFDVRTGLTAAGGKPGSNAWTLTEREARLFRAALRTETGLDVLSRPQLMMTDNQQGFFQISAETEIVRGLDAVTKDGVTLYAPRKEVTNLGPIFRVTPRLSPDGKTVLLRCNIQTSSLDGTAVEIPVTNVPASTGQARPAVIQCYSQPVIDIQTLETTVEVPTGGTVVLGGLVRKTAGGARTESVWVLTPTVQAAGQPAPAEKSPTPAK